MTNENLWTKILSPNEKIKYEFSIGNGYLKFGLIAGCVSGFILLFLAVWLGFILILTFGFYYGYYLKRANNYAFSDKRVLIHMGWLSTKLISIDYDKITDIEVQEPFLDKLFFGTGNLFINTAGTTLREVILKDIESPYEIKKKLDELRKS